MFIFGKIGTACRFCHHYEILGIVRTEGLVHIGTICPACQELNAVGHYELLPEEVVAFVANELKNAERKPQQELHALGVADHVVLEDVMLALCAAAADEGVNFNDLLLKAAFNAKYKTEEA